MRFDRNLQAMFRMHRHTLYVTYDLPQGGDPTRIVRGARSQEILGELVRREVGEFQVESGRRVRGVRLTLAFEEEENLEREVIELPPLAQNVQVHIDHLPDAYRSALKPAA